MKNRDLKYKNTFLVAKNFVTAYLFVKRSLFLVLLFFSSLNAQIFISDGAYIYAEIDSSASALFLRGKAAAEEEEETLLYISKEAIVYDDEARNTQVIKKVEFVSKPEKSSSAIKKNKKDNLKISRGVVISNTNLFSKNEAEDFLQVGKPMCRSAVLSIPFSFAYFRTFYEICLVKKLGFLYILIIIFFSVILFSEKILSTNNFRRPPPFLL